MKFSQLGFFCAVVERGAITTVIEQLRCVPSNITTRLRELERQLSVALFSRERDRPLVIPKGRLLYRHAWRLLALADETAALFAGDQAHGMLWVDALDVVLANCPPQRLARYHRGSPGVKLHIRPEHSLLLERLLMEEKLGLIVTDSPIKHPLLANRLVFYGHLLRVTPADLPTPTSEGLADFGFYVFGRTYHYRRQAGRWLAESAIQPRVTLGIESYPSLFACIEAGPGFACVPESLVTHRPSTRRGFHVEPIAGLDSSDIHFIWRKQQASPLIQGFIDNVSAD